MSRTGLHTHFERVQAGLFSISNRWACASKDAGGSIRVAATCTQRVMELVSLSIRAAGGSAYGTRRMCDFFVRHLHGVEPRLE